MSRPAVARPCTFPGCNAIVRGSSRCPDHPIIHRVSPDHRNKPATARGYSRFWYRLVKIAIARQPSCSQCGTDQNLTGDHIVPLSRGGTNTFENITVLCRACNGRKGGK